MSQYRLEFYKDERGDEPVRRWLREGLSRTQRLVVGTAMREVLEVNGVGVCGTEYGRQLGGGLFEFRVRGSLEELVEGTASTRMEPAEKKLLIRVFCHAHGDKLILLLAGYDKLAQPSRSHQGEQIGSRGSALRPGSWRRRRLAPGAGSLDSAMGIFPYCGAAQVRMPMSRKPTSFDEFMQEVEEETRAAGPEAQAQAEALRDHFRLAAQVVRRRKELRLTQQQLAARVGVHQSEISDIERGAASPGYRMLVKLADGLHADVALVPRAGAPRPVQKHVAARRSARAPAHARLVRPRAAR